MLIQGTTSGSIMSTALNIPCTIKSISLYNKTGGAIVTSVGIVVSGTDRYIFNANLAIMGTSGSSFYQLTDINVPAEAQILIVTSGSVDYVITVE